MAEVVAPGPVKEDDGPDVFGIGLGEVERIVGAQRETHHGKAAVSLSHTFVEKYCCLRDLGVGLEVVGAESFGKGFRICNVVRELAIIEVWSEGDETCVGQSRAAALFNHNERWAWIQR